MEKKVDLTSISQALTADDIERSAPADSGIADEIKDLPGETGATPFSSSHEIHNDISAEPNTPGAEQYIDIEKPADSDSTSGAGEDLEVNSSQKSGSILSRAAAEVEASARPQVLSRRHMITLVISLAAGVIAVSWTPLLEKLGSIWQLLASRRVKNHPFFRADKSAAIYAPVELGEGFYARRLKPFKTPLPAGARRRNIIQYVDSAKHVPFVQIIDEGKLTPANSSQLAVNGFTLSASAKSRFPATHVSLARASVLFEMATVQRLRAQQYDQACQLLINGIRHDLAFKRHVGGPPSLRLLDLLARVSIRRNQGHHFQELLKLSNESMSLIERQNIDPAARRKGRKNNPPTKKGRRPDNPRKRRLPLDPTAQESVRSTRKAGLQARLKNWQDTTWQNTLKSEKKVEWAITLPDETPTAEVEIRERTIKARPKKNSGKVVRVEI